MKILYAVQATGNGHISRAIEIMPFLEQYGQVDVFLSGSNHNLTNCPNVKYRSKGLSFSYSANGGISYLKTAFKIAPYRMIKEATQLPVENYDLILNDFESITALACMLKGKKSIGFGHQASFMSANTPRPSTKEFLGELVLKNYAKAQQYVGLHFKNYDGFVLPPIIRKDVWNSKPNNQGHVTVYLSAYANKKLFEAFSKIKNCDFHIFSRETTEKIRIENITFLPINMTAFNKSVLSCQGIITGGGFETPAEALYLGKKLLVVPIKNQYEQACNAAALEQLGVWVTTSLNSNFDNLVNNWLDTKANYQALQFTNTETIISQMMQIALGANQQVPDTGALAY
jgi:uncharacterized protein (TIGR00661 family)